jgi:hypothetical protein
VATASFNPGLYPGHGYCGDKQCAAGRMLGIALRERVLWQMLYETAARAEEL